MPELRHEGYGGVNQIRLGSRGTPRQEDSLSPDRKLRERVCSGPAGVCSTVRMSIPEMQALATL